MGITFEKINIFLPGGSLLLGHTVCTVNLGTKNGTSTYKFKIESRDVHRTLCYGNKLESSQASEDKL